MLLLAGCVANTPTPPTGSGPDAASAVAVAPIVDAKATLAELKAFSEAYPYRQSGQQTHLGSRDYLAKQFSDAGLEVIRQKFPSTMGVPPVPYTGENIIGVKWGEDRERWIVVGAHYDITEGAVYGAYDDGSGTIMTTNLAKAFATIGKTNRTIAFVQFDQEEKGLVGSRYFVKSVTDGSFEAPNVVVDGMIDLDMIGITWPHPAHMIVWENSEALKAKTIALANATGMPEKNLEFREPSGGSSDGAAFIAADIPTAYFWSDWDDYVLPDGSVMPRTPVPYVGPYPWWHKADTYETMVLSAGDEETLRKGFQTTLDIVSPLLVYMAGPEFVAPTA